MLYPVKLQSQFLYLYYFQRIHRESLKSFAVFEYMQKSAFTNKWVQKLTIKPHHEHNIEIVFLYSQNTILIEPKTYQLSEAYIGTS